MPERAQTCQVLCEYDGQNTTVVNLSLTLSLSLSAVLAVLAHAQA